MMKIFFCFFCVFTVFFSCNAQGFAGEIGYKNLGHSYLQTGVSYRLTPDSRDGNVWYWNANAFFLTNFKHKNVFGAGVQTRIYYVWETGISITNKYVEPQLGINLLNFLKINTGYSIPYEKNNLALLIIDIFCDFAK
ncbi:MAG: hypothetical protein Q4G16_08035 [Cruoricaptor ignavus]|nr:hypothetical protein [Cruoricaptor ignavus]